MSLVNLNLFFFSELYNPFVESMNFYSHFYRLVSEPINYNVCRSITYLLIFFFLISTENCSIRKGLVLQQDFEITDLKFFYSQ